MLFGESSDEDTETINKMMQESSSGNLPTEHNGTSNAKRIENLENRDEASIVRSVNFYRFFNFILFC